MTPRRGPLVALFLLVGLAGAGGAWMQPRVPAPAPLDAGFLIRAAEVRRHFLYPEGERKLSFRNQAGDFAAWRARCKEKLAELLHVTMPRPCQARELRRTTVGGVRVTALVLEVSADLTLPGYLLAPDPLPAEPAAVLAIHGHGEVEPCVGARDDYHHQFALRLAQAGFLVLCPELRGFGLLSDLAADRPGHRLDYWNQARRVNDRQFTLVTDGLQRGHTLVGDTVEDLLRWEDWLARTHRLKTVHAAGISYGGDLALTYPVFSTRVERIFASGTFGSFTPIFARYYNAPAHCVPGVLRWLDRADLAGLNAPRPLALHYGERDTPSPDNYSASYNETVAPALRELEAIYTAAGAKDRPRLIVSKGKGHEMDVEALVAFLKEGGW